MDIIEMPIIPKDNVKWLKRFATLFIGGTLTTADIPGNTVSDVLAFMCEYVTPQNELENKPLTVNCVAGSITGTTVITVEGATNLDRVYLYPMDTAPRARQHIGEIVDITNPVMPAGIALDYVYKIKLDEDINVGSQMDGMTQYMVELDEDNYIIAAGAFTVSVKLT